MLGCMAESGSCERCGTPYGKRKRCYRCNRGGSPMQGQNRTCRTCAKQFYVPRWQLEDERYQGGTYCSHDCKSEGQLVVASKPCTMCEVVKPLDEFPPDKRTISGRQSRCRACCQKISARWREDNPEHYEALKKTPRTEQQRLRRFQFNLEKNYGLTLTDYEVLLSEQGGGCAICGGQPGGPGKGGKSFHVDHDHVCCPGVGSCGKCVRGLLCSNCNTMLGLAKENPRTLLSAVAYLQAA